MSNPLPSITPIENTKARYALAKASSRIGARIVDLIIILFIIIGIAFLIIATDSAGIKNALELQQTWRYFLISLESLSIFIIYFLIVPFLTKGKTIGLLIFKLRIYNLIPTKNFFVNLIKREAFIWMIGAFTNLVLGIALMTMNSINASEFIKKILFSSNTSTTSTNQGATAIFQAFYLINAVILIFVIIHMCVYNKRRCFIDHISDTVVIKLVDIAGQDPNSSSNVKIGKRRRNYGLPGEILPGAESEIDSL